MLKAIALSISVAFTAAAMSAIEQPVVLNASTASTSNSTPKSFDDKYVYLGASAWAVGPYIDQANATWFFNFNKAKQQKLSELSYRLEQIRHQGRAGVTFTGLSLIIVFAPISLPIGLSCLLANREEVRKIVEEYNALDPIVRIVLISYSYTTFD